MRSSSQAHPPAGGDDGLWLALSAAGLAVCVVDARATILWSNAPFGDLFNTTPSDATGEPLLGVINIDEQPAVRSPSPKSSMAPMRSAVSSRFHPRRRCPPRPHALAVARPDCGTETPGVVVVEDRTHLVQPLRNIIEQKFQLRHATEGSLAGLPSRSTLEFLLASSLRPASERHIPFALLFSQIEGLEAIAHRHGHEAVDEMRWIAAARMNPCCACTTPWRTSAKMSSS